MLRISRPALRADFRRYYDLDLRACLAGMHGRLVDIGDLAVELPRGARIWVHMGGPTAVTGETEMLMQVDYTIRHVAWQFSGSKGQEPKPHDYPLSAKAIEQQAEKVTNKAERWKQRHMQRTTE